MSAESPPTGAGAPREEEILDSWKEIASYLGRAVRTVQIWEKQEGLPVHRHQHLAGGTVYAYPSEIDAWRLAREDLDKEGSDPSRWTRGLGLAGAALAIVAAAGWLWTARSPEDDPARSLRPLEGGALLIAGFDNVTGEEVLDGTLQAALERDLAGRGFVQLVSRERLGDSLQLIGRPLDATIDTALAREIALRDRDIHAVVLGSIERRGSTYVLSLEVLDPIDGVVLARLREEAAGQQEILPAVGRLSLRIRESLGESSPTEQVDGSPGGVPAPSLRALQLYTRADRLFVEANRGGTFREEAAEALLREAIAEDPEFAAAHTHLAWAIRRQWRAPDEYLTHAARGLELADRATVVERYFIRGSYFHMRSIAYGARSDAEAALAQFQALLELDPDHYWAIENSFSLLRNLGRGQETLELSLRALRARPNDTAALSRAARQLVEIKGDLEEARHHVERARELWSELPIETKPSDPFLVYFPVHELWVRGDVGEVVQSVDDIVESAGSLAAAESKNLVAEAITYYLELGMFERAEELQELYSVFPPRAWQFRIAWRRGDWDVVRELDLWRAETGQPDVLVWVAADLATLGYPDDAERILDQLPPEFDLQGGLISSARGATAFARRRYQDAVMHLEEAFHSLRYGSLMMSYYLQSAKTLARAWEALGQPEQAVSVLEEVSRQKPRVLYGRFVWLEAQLRLAEVYRGIGQVAQALAIEDEVRKYCAFADPDFPVLVELQRRD